MTIEFEKSIKNAIQYSQVLRTAQSRLGWGERYHVYQHIGNFATTEGGMLYPLSGDRGDILTEPQVYTRAILAYEVESKLWDWLNQIFVQVIGLQKAAEVMQNAVPSLTLSSSYESAASSKHDAYCILILTELEKLLLKEKEEQPQPEIIPND